MYQLVLVDSSKTDMYLFKNALLLPVSGASEELQHPFIGLVLT